MVEFPKPKTMVEIRRYLRMVNYYCRTIPRATVTHASLNHYLCDSCENDKHEIHSNAESVAAFENVKRDLANVTFLAHSFHDAKKLLVTDASK